MQPAPIESSHANVHPLKSVCAIKLDMFEGPLDLLLHLIQKNEMEITDIPIAEITEQYLEYLNLMEMLDLDVASDLLVMAATLLRLKSQSILPSSTPDDSQTFKDREELVRQLLEYKRFKEVAQALDHYAAKQEKIYGRSVDEEANLEAWQDVQIKATLLDLLSAFKRMTEQRQPVEDDYYEEIREEPVTVEKKMEFLAHRLSDGEQVQFDGLFSEYGSKLERIVTFLAVLELMRLQQIIVVQSGTFDSIYIVKRDA